METNAEFSNKYRTYGQELMIIVFRFLLVFLVITSSAAAFVYYKSFFIEKAYVVATKINEKVLNNAIPIKNEYAFLLLGTDMLIDVNRTDTIILAFLSVPNMRIDIVSVPRDTKIEIPGHGTQKINAVYTFEFVKTKSESAAIKKIVTKVEEISGAKIDYFVKVDLKGFEKIVDLFGGVEMDVEKNMTYDDNKQDLHIRLKKGLQVLNGKLALQYCRFRHDRLGDIGRMQRQQKFMKAMVARAKEGKTLMRLPDIISGAMRFVTTSVDLPLMLALVGAIPEPSKLTIHSHTMPGDFGDFEEICYFLPEIEKFKKLVANIRSGEIIEIEEEKARAEALKKEAEEQKKNGGKAPVQSPAGNKQARPPQGAPGTSAAGPSAASTEEIRSGTANGNAPSPVDGPSASPAAGPSVAKGPGEGAAASGIAEGTKEVSVKAPVDASEAPAGGGKAPQASEPQKKPATDAGKAVDKGGVKAPASAGGSVADNVKKSSAAPAGERKKDGKKDAAKSAGASRGKERAKDAKDKKPAPGGKESVAPPAGKAGASGKTAGVASKDAKKKTGARESVVINVSDEPAAPSPDQPKAADAPDAGADKAAADNDEPAAGPAHDIPIDEPAAETPAPEEKK